MTGTDPNTDLCLSSLEARPSKASMTEMQYAESITDNGHEISTHRTACTSGSGSGGSKLQFWIDRKVTLAFFPLCLLTLMVALEAASLSIALPVVTEELRGSAIEAFWSGTSFVLCSACCQLIFTSLSTAFGRQLLIVVAVIFFLVGTIVSGVATNFTEMLVGRSIQGTGGGGIIALSEVSVTDMIPFRLRGAYWGVLGSMWSIGSVIGPIMGGGFSTNSDWRWIFYINVPFAALCIPLILIYLKIKTKRTTRREKLRNFDTVGLVLFVCSTASFLIALSWGGVMYAWHSWRVLVPLIIGTFGIIGVMVYETHIPTDPILQVSGIDNHSLLISYIGTVLQGLTLWCILYYLPLYAEAVHGFRPLPAGVAALPLAFAIAPSACASGIIAVLSGRYRILIWIGWAVATLGFGILCYFDRTTKGAIWISLIAIPGLGLGGLVTSIAYAIQACSETRHLATATALFSFFRAFGQSLGVAIGGVIFQNRMEVNLQKYPALAPMAKKISHNAVALVGKMQTEPPSQDKDDLRQAYTDSLRAVWVFCCACTAIGGLLSLLTKEYSIDQNHDTDQGLEE
ncbi:major facilitator superfamily domain-containing protein [Aspergillus pseudonomiae]|uniref:Major facilitator superfamily domain-containing protein n=1 Tax=Aspergillus pseudonomiae TaxID=1506151 RepID=A0A5N6I5U4_9EURO|nr:major facilitator superfamily domain-containing protein [Aspergillus pseudonomiae]KAB8262081.1 major facilitator superfamily domain-containing protein [Aspergillus pseudonomiae]KAE8402659.1 major facilitator superfamily domain-containing protein [Aspergillus pseudonomiae]